MAYGTKVTGDLDAAEAEAIARESRYYQPVGWLFRAEVVSYSYVVDADRDLAQRMLQSRLATPEPIV